jgi:hypothetical protein
MVLVSYLHRPPLPKQVQILKREKARYQDGWGKKTEEKIGAKNAAWQGFYRKGAMNSKT